MVNIDYYFNDGANFQSQVILMILKGNTYEVIDRNYDNENHHNHISVEVGRYENCREQGYIVSFIYDYHQVAHYAFAEHRNSDSVLVNKFKGQYINTPNIDAVWQGKQSKYDTDRMFEYGKWVECAEWIITDAIKEMEKYIENKKSTDNNG